MKICEYYFLMYDVLGISNFCSFRFMPSNGKKLLHRKYCKMVIKSLNKNTTGAQIFSY